ncbi:MAG TPA: 2-keto-4-pentenoate hydratase [Arthrobacter sp.]|nr:2-keto-4-pentenoate hydratase [Arthrobacter sp.]
MPETPTATNAALVAPLAEALLAAYASRQPVEPLTGTHPGLTLEQAYAVQEHQVNIWKAGGRTVVGYKVGLTSLAMQKQLGVDQPDFGRLLDDMVLDPAEPISLNRFISPKIEPEISFVLKTDLRGPGLTLEDVTAAVDYAVTSLEIIDSRIADWRITLADTIADNASSGALVLGSEHIALDSQDLAATAVTLAVNGKVVGEGTGSAVLGHPLNGLLWVANTLGGLGQTLEAGSVVMSGSVTAAVPISAGDTVTASFSGLKPIEVHFS